MLRTSFFFALVAIAHALHPAPHPSGSRNVSLALFNSLEELARLVDITYCVGSTGIQKPFQCLSRCDEFPGFELVSTWHTGQLLSDSCGYVAISHPPHPKRIIVAFRGTYSIANTIADLSTIPAVYEPFPGDDGDGKDACTTMEEGARQARMEAQGTQEREHGAKCENCTVHLGFMTSWRNTRCIITPYVRQARLQYPDYQLSLVGHSLGGAVAALASLEFQTLGWDPQVTTFGEPRIGNGAFSRFFDERFNLSSAQQVADRYRRVTHASDPVPLLPLEEWGYQPHSGEIFISRYDLPPAPGDLELCSGEHDPRCISGSHATQKSTQDLRKRDLWHIPGRYKLWELFFAHRDYFWRLGLCVPRDGHWWSPFSPSTPKGVL